MIVWWEVEAREPETFQRFHGALWGWQFRPAFAESELNEEYWIIETADGDAIGGLQRSRSTADPHPGVRLYVQVGDLEQALDDVAANGGRIERRRTKLGGTDGWFGTAIDPAGISFGLWTAASAIESGGSDHPELAPGVRDLVNPTGAEITSWAYSGEQEPMMDWDLIISDERHGQLLIDLVADEQCPTRSYLLACLYVLAGDAVRSQYNATAEKRLTYLIGRADQSDEPWLRTWAARTRALMAAPDTFDYDAWCDFGLSSRPIDT